MSDASRTSAPGLRRPSFGVARGAIFLDRDGTLIRDRHYIKDPDQVELIPEATNAVRFINYNLMSVVVVTNQSGIARGIMTEAEYERVRDRLDDMLAERNAFIDATYHCPHHPDFTGACECRKPGTSLYRRALQDLNLDAKRSVFIGDRWHDIEPALAFGARGILVPSPETPDAEIVRAAREMEIAPNLTAAVHSVFGVPPTDSHE